MVSDPGPLSSSHWGWNNPAFRALSSLVGAPLGFLLPAWFLTSLIFPPLHRRFLAGYLF